MGRQFYVLSSHLLPHISENRAQHSFWVLNPVWRHLSGTNLSSISYYIISPMLNWGTRMVSIDCIQKSPKCAVDFTIETCSLHHNLWLVFQVPISTLYTKLSVLFPVDLGGGAEMVSIVYFWNAQNTSLIPRFETWYFLGYKKNNILGSQRHVKPLPSHNVHSTLDMT